MEEEVIDTQQNLEETLNEFLKRAVDEEDAEKSKIYANAAKDVTSALVEMKKVDMEKSLESKKLEESKKSRKTNIILTAGGWIIGFVTLGINLIFTHKERIAITDREKMDIVTTNPGREVIRDSIKRR